MHLCIEILLLAGEMRELVLSVERVQSATVQEASGDDQSPLLNVGGGRESQCALACDFKMCHLLFV